MTNKFSNFQKAREEVSVKKRNGSIGKSRTEEDLFFYSITLRTSNA